MRGSSAELERLVGQVPYLNGGIFDVHELERPDRYGEAIEIPDAAFEHIFDYFDQYQWHLDERPLRADNEINPDVLGYIFEKYINQKQMGAYYTKEDITGYISRNTVLPSLFDAAQAKCKIAFENANGPTVWNLLREDPDRYIYPAVRHGISWDVHANGGKGAPLETPRALPPDIAEGLDTEKPNLIERRRSWNKPAPSDYALPTEIWREVIERRVRYKEIRQKIGAGEVSDSNELITLNLDLHQFTQDAIENSEGPELLRAFWHSIEQVTILDPTCGSGAFLFSALNVLEPLYEACLDRMERFVEDLNRSNKKHRPERFSDFRKVLGRMGTHPNPRYFVLKSIILNNLFGVDIMEEAAEICKLRLFLKLAAQVEPDHSNDNIGIEPLPDIDFNIRAGNTLIGYATYDDVKLAATAKLDFSNDMDKINVKAADLQQAFNAFRWRQIEGDRSVPTEDKHKLRKRLKTLGDELDRYLAREYGVESAKTEAYQKWLRFHQPFHWFVEFYGIMDAGGFDVIIGNPPWVEFAKVKHQYIPKGLTTLECNNLWAYIVERSYTLWAEGARMGLIVPMSLVCTERMIEIQKLVKGAGISWLSNFESDSNPGQLFEGVKQNVTILLNKRTPERRLHITRMFRFFQEFRDWVFPIIAYVEWVDKNPIHFGFPKISTLLELRILSKLFSKAKLVTEIKNVGGHEVLVHRIAHYYIKCFDFVPFFRSDRDGIKKSEDYKRYFFGGPATLYVAGVNSNTFYFYWQVFFDAFKAGKLCVESFPYGIFGDAGESAIQSQLVTLSRKLMNDVKANSTRLKARYSTTGQVEYDQYYPRKSKPIIDEIDGVLARHYGFTEVELDFIINYDIKYRMGRDTDDADE